MCVLDHLALSATTLSEGVEAVEAALGVPLGPGGQHPSMGTHNRLLGLGEIYLEVIAIDPDAPAPGRPRWFALDEFAGPPRMTNWIARCDDLEAALSDAPDGTGEPLPLTRGDLRWRMAVPEDGRLPFGGAFPALIQWQGAAHPVTMLPDSGCRLKRLEIRHPQAGELQIALAPLFEELPASVTAGSLAIRAEIETPHGLKVLE
ncbi:VOC family protein [Pseudoruegeria sp. HB172150]|uniref:VOC family protein n=1 Tax=Pseudoruegeria sp. HB172150 TaxID=2721164 RepID=UPI001551EAB6